MQKVWVLFIQGQKKIFFEAKRPKDLDALIESLEKSSV